MQVLAIETTGKEKSICLARDGRVIDQESFTGDLNLEFWPRLSRFLEKHKIKIGEIDLFAASSGPGSWTGLRFGLAVLKGWAVATGKKVFVLSTSEIEQNLAPGICGASVLACRCDGGVDPEKVVVHYGHLPHFQRLKDG